MPMAVHPQSRHILETDAMPNASPNVPGPNTLGCPRASRRRLECARL